MRRITNAAVLALVVLGLSLAPSAAQEGDEYQLVLPQGWELNSYTDGARIKRVEYIYGDRSNAVLKVKRVRLGRDDTIEAIVDREIGALRFQPGFVQGRSEDFSGGGLAGKMIQFDFTRSGKPMLGRHYYLAGGDSTVWVMQFTGDRTSLGQMRNVTDQMARSFRAK